jgi:hypothetical protein
MESTVVTPLPPFHSNANATGADLLIEPGVQSLHILALSP